MTDTVDPTVGIITFRRRVKAAGPSGTAELSASIPFGIESTDSYDVVMQKARDAAYHVKGLVLEQLDLPFTIDEQTGMIMETTTYADLMTARVDATGVEASPLPERPEHVDAELWADLLANPDNWFDNRADKARGVDSNGRTVKPNSPDFKRRGDGKSIFLTPYTRGGSR